jgi:hypothetical protein
MAQISFSTYVFLGTILDLGLTSKSYKYMNKEKSNINLIKIYETKDLTFPQLIL